MSFYEIAFPYFKVAYDIVDKEYIKTIPKHLHSQMGNFLSNYLNTFVTCSLFDAVKDGILSKPEEHNKMWLSLFSSSFK